ncbi:aminoacyl-histidine dipeptidase [Alistipes sp. CAG:29]|nr:aminoacyl-histidine dipeptidase [Alistipes sp. CAG:29]
MDKNLSALKPALVWKHFAQIVRIPRPSSHEEKIRKYVMDFAKSRGLECKEDAAHNVYVRKPASKGMEDRKGVILQAHLDMVPQKNNDKKFDFTKDPIDAYVDGEWVTADGTTLGADNGIGAAAILAVLEDDTLVHGPLEALFTATEETGMDGAFGLKKGLLRGDILLTLDSATEGETSIRRPKASCMWAVPAGSMPTSPSNIRRRRRPHGIIPLRRSRSRGSRAAIRASRSDASVPMPTRCCSAS